MDIFNIKMVKVLKIYEIVDDSNWQRNVNKDIYCICMQNLEFF